MYTYIIHIDVYCFLRCKETINYIYIIIQLSHTNIYVKRFIFHIAFVDATYTRIHIYATD